MTILAAATARQENGLREDHKRDLKLFHDTVDIKKDLKSQIAEAIDPIYLEDLKDPVTNTITQTIPEIVTYLLDNYGDVRPEEVTKEEDKIKNIDFSINTPLSTLYKKVDHLLELSTAVGSPYTT